MTYTNTHLRLQIYESWLNDESDHAIHMLWNVACSQRIRFANTEQLYLTCVYYVQTS